MKQHYQNAEMKGNATQNTDKENNKDEQAQQHTENMKKSDKQRT